MIVAVPFVLAAAPKQHIGALQQAQNSAVLTHALASVNLMKTLAHCDPTFTFCTPGTDAHVAKLEHIAHLKKKHGVLKQSEPCSGTKTLEAGSRFEQTIDVPFLGAQNVHMHVTAPGVAEVMGSGIQAFTCKSALFHQSGQAISLDANSCHLPEPIQLRGLRFCADQQTVHATISTPYNEIAVVAPRASKTVHRLQATPQTPAEQLASAQTSCNSSMASAASSLSGPFMTDSLCASFATQVVQSFSSSSNSGVPAACDFDTATLAGSTTCAATTSAIANFCAPLYSTGCVNFFNNPPASGGGSSCFAKDASLACRASQHTTDSHAAHAACYADHADGSAAQLVRLIELSAGDRIVTLDANNAPTLTRVVVNQHKSQSRSSPMLKISTADGAALTVTPDHVIAVEGAFVAAEEARVGMHLSAGRIMTIERTTSAIVNPVTASGTLLVADVAAPHMPVLASSHPKWISSFMLNAPTFPFVASHLASYTAPHATQALYEQVEGVLDYLQPTLERAAPSIPRALDMPLVLVADAAFAIGLLLYSFALPLGVAGAAYLLHSKK
jgi:hypothetical protein